jgi:hypothetical protein
MNRRDILIRLLRERRDTDPTNPYVLFLGAGASLTSGASLFSRVFDGVGATSYDDFSSLVQSLSDTERHVLLSAHVNQTAPSLAALELASLVRDGYFSIVLTTNFDNVLEKALQDIGLGPDDFVVLVNEHRAPLSRLNALLGHPSPRIKIVKLHGDVSRRSYALTRQETVQFAKPVEDALRQLFSERDIILVGTRFADLDLLRLVPATGDGALWHVNPSRPEGHFLGTLQARGAGANTIEGDAGHFESFIGAVFGSLGGNHFAPLKGTWWLLAPCFLASDPRSGVGEQSAVRESDRSVLAFETSGHTTELHWFDGGLAVWVVRRPLAFNSVSEYATARRGEYRSILAGQHALAAHTRHLLKSLAGAPGGALLPASGIGYVLSCVEASPDAWPERLRAGGLRLVSCPSLFDDDPPADEREDTGSGTFGPDVTARQLRKEAALLQGDVPGADHCCFSVPGLLEGYACWAGVAWAQLSSGAQRTCDALMRYEIEVQACWWCLHHLKACAEERLDEKVREYMERTRLASRVSRLLTIGPTEHTVARRFREAIIESSRIKELWQDVRSITAAR